MFINKNRKHSYILLLAISLLLVAGAWKLGWIPSMETRLKPPPREQISDKLSKVPDKTIDRESSTTLSGNFAQADIETEAVPRILPLPNADRTYFKDALFIGDSRTVGLYEYGDLGEAIVLADSGMNIYKVFNRSFSLPEGEELTLEEILTQKQFGKIYLMLGINELGYDFEQTVKLYEDVVAQIETLQPEAILFLQANLHITKEKSEGAPIFNNENINRFNTEVRRMAEASEFDKRVFLDVNVLFDDEEGALSTEYTADAAHVLGKYYADWVAWLLQHAVSYGQ